MIAVHEQILLTVHERAHEQGLPSSDSTFYRYEGQQCVMRYTGRCAVPIANFAWSVGCFIESGFQRMALVCEAHKTCGCTYLDITQAFVKFWIQ
jgi:hypothetical protein